MMLLRRLCALHAEVRGDHLIVAPDLVGRPDGEGLAEIEHLDPLADLEDDALIARVLQIVAAQAQGKGPGGVTPARALASVRDQPSMRRPLL